MFIDCILIENLKLLREGMLGDGLVVVVYGK
jgi:hypothetical protein